MFNYPYPDIGRLDRLCKGHYIICQFGYPYLVCKPVDKPDDPLLQRPLAQFVTCSDYGQQFLQNLHSWRNDNEIVNKLFGYLTNDNNQSSTSSSRDNILVLASALESGDLIVIPLDKEE